jgi:hypothetical protein
MLLQNNFGKLLNFTYICINNLTFFEFLIFKILNMLVSTLSNQELLELLDTILIEATKRNDLNLFSHSEQQKMDIYNKTLNSIKFKKEKEESLRIAMVIEKKNNEKAEKEKNKAAADKQKKIMEIEDGMCYKN